MHDLKTKLENIRIQTQAAWETIELDYALSWVLAAISKHPILSKNLAFKGGTALKKCYFGDYRYSQDLDFSEINLSTNAELDPYITEITTQASRFASAYSDLSFSWQRYQEKKPHPHNQAAYTIRAQFPWHSTPLTKVKLEISRDEPLVLDTQQHPIIHEYNEEFSFVINSYQIEEIVAEKFRAILQNQNKFFSKGWARSRVRDLYDLWRILSKYKADINMDTFMTVFLKKCSIKDVIFRNSEQFFNAEYLAYIQKDWQAFLGGLVMELPDFTHVISELKVYTTELFSEKQNTI